MWIRLAVCVCVYKHTMFITISPAGPAGSCEFVQLTSDTVLCSSLPVASLQLSHCAVAPAHKQIQEEEK